MENNQNGAPPNQTFTINSSFKSFNGNSQNKQGSKKTMLFATLGVIVAAIIFGFVVYKIAGGRATELLKPLADKKNYFPIGRKVTNPLTGIEYDVGEIEWEDQRPMAIMMNNFIDARPQSGLIYADLVYEVVAEGGITRYLPFYLTNAPEKIGPVRSTREYYLVLVKELGDAMLMHIGWSPQALEAIETWPVRSLGRGGATFWRDNPDNVAIEHTAYVDGVNLRERAAELGWQGTRPFDMWQFKDENICQDCEGLMVGEETPIEIHFWYEGDYSGIFKYDRATNEYLRFTGYDATGVPIPTVDRETGEQVKVKNVIIQFADESSIVGDDKNRLDYQLIGSGMGLVFRDGTVVEATWSKEDRDGRTKFYDTNGEEMKYNRGKFWISIVPSRNVDQVSY